jgi:hypothetical protein
VVLARSDVRLNQALRGGGIELSAGSLEINGSTIARNISDTSGGGLSADAGAVDLSASTLRENEADYSGGGAALSDVTATLTNCTVTQNSADAGGGLAALPGSSVEMNNCTVTLNSASTRAPGVDTDGAVQFTLSNSILAGNDSVDCYGTLSSRGHNLFGELGADCVAVGDLTGNLTGLDPLLMPLGSPTGYRVAHMPRSSSPAIDAGNPVTPGSGPGACEPTDQMGKTRGLSTACDMGSVEYLAIDPFGCDLLRNDDIVGLSPVTPALESIFNGAVEGCSVDFPTLNVADPEDCAWAVYDEGASTPLPGSDDLDDLYGFCIAFGSCLDPDTGLLSDTTRPLMFWQLVPSLWCGDVLKAVKDTVRDSVAIHTG